MREVLTGVDPNKDQTYFLAMMKPDQVQAARFPVGELLKSEVRETAKRFGLPNAEKKDSQGICFIGQIKMSDFLETYLPDEPGNIVDTDGKVLGEHRGLHFYTLGQRKGIGVPSNQYKKNYVVVEKRKATGELVIAFEGPEAPGLFQPFRDHQPVEFYRNPHLHQNRDAGPAPLPRPVSGHYLHPSRGGACPHRMVRTSTCHCRRTDLRSLRWRGAEGRRDLFGG